MRLKANGISLNYAFSGHQGAPVVVLHHALSVNRGMWDMVARALEDEYRVLRFDARGHGQTDAPDGPYEFETLSKDALGLMDMLGIDKAHFLGLSMGGIVGQHLGLLAPDRFESLTLVSTQARVPDEGKAAWNDRIAAVKERGMEGQVQPTLQRWFTESFRATGDPVLDDIAQMVRKTPVKGFIGWGLAIRELDIADRLPQIALPTLVIVGEHDPGTPVAAAQLIHDKIEGSELRIVEDASHQVPLERPQEFLNMVTSFLATV